MRSVAPRDAPAWLPAEPAWARAIATGLGALLVLLGAAGSMALLLAPRLVLPAEDAVILFQYSRNLAQTGAITYIPHGPHAEGATDFAWMLLVAAGIKLHLPPYWIVSTVSFVSVFLLVFFVLRTAKERVTPLRLLAGAGVFVLMPQYLASATGFSALPFACLIAWLALAVQRRLYVAAPVVALALCLLRPDGIVFAAPLLILSALHSSERKRVLALDTVFFVLPGLAYFVWRWHYFGYFLPLPFYVKSNVHRLAGLLVRSSILSGTALLLFALAMVWIALRRQPRGEDTRGLFLCLLIVPSLFYFAMRLDQNIGHRFFVYLPAGAAIIIASAWPQAARRGTLLLSAGLCLWMLLVLPLWLEDADEGWQHQLTERVALARAMARVPHGSIISTEAGVLPYESGWTTYDAWGLNTPRFAKTLLQPQDVSELHPDVVLALPTGSITGNEPCIPQANWKVPYTDRSWTGMTRNLIAGTSAADYDLLVLPFGNLQYREHHGISRDDGGNECWFVRRDSAAHDPMVALLEGHGALSGEAYRRLLQAHQQAALTAPPPVVHHDLRHYMQVIPGRIHNLLQD